MDSSDNSRLIALKYLVAQFIQARKDEDWLNKKLEEMRTARDLAGTRRSKFQGILTLEDIDPENIPPDLLPDDPSLIPDESQPAAPDEPSDTPTQQPLVVAENNGHSQASEWPTPLNETHAIFLVFRNLDNPWLDSEEIYRHNLKFGYGLSKEDVTRGLGRQMSRPQKMFLRDGNKYKLSAEGLVFDKFRKKPERAA